MAVDLLVLLFPLLAFLDGVACQDPQPPILFVDKDEPEWKLGGHKYEESSNEKAILSDYYACTRQDIIREVFAEREQKKVEAYAVPIRWSGVISVMSKIPPAAAISTFIEVGVWPEIILPFLHALLGIVIIIVTIIPLIVVGAVGFILLFNVRHFGAKRIRMMIRGLLIKMEKFRRWKYEMSFPRQHLRKFQERDRYHMPEAFQNSDLSSDDEPKELRRQPIPRKITTLWTTDDIEIIGFDPDNLPVETIYGDLLGQPESLDPLVLKYLNSKRSEDEDWREGLGRGSLDSDDWAEVLKQQVANKRRSGSGFLNLLSFGDASGVKKKATKVEAKKKGRNKRGPLSKGTSSSRSISRSVKSNHSKKSSARSKSSALRPPPPRLPVRRTPTKNPVPSKPSKPRKAPVLNRPPTFQKRRVPTKSTPTPKPKVQPKPIKPKPKIPTPTTPNTNQEESKLSVASARISNHKPHTIEHPTESPPSQPPFAATFAQTAAEPSPHLNPNKILPKPKAGKLKPVDKHWFNVQKARGSPSSSSKRRHWQ